MANVKKSKSDGNIFKELRRSINLSQIEVAQFIGVEQTTVSKWERGLTIPDQSVLPKIAKLYNTSVDYLLTGTSNQNNNIISKKSNEIEELYNKLTPEEQNRVKGYIHALLSDHKDINIENLYKKIK